MTVHIGVLGCGPAGLLATHAAIQAGARVTILSRKRKSHLNGAQYLHGGIPGTPSGDSPPINVHYVLQGEADGYRRKVYGPTWDGTVSPEELAEDHPAWDIRETYDWLWEEYSDHILGMEIDPALTRALADSKDFDGIVTSVPAPLLCAHGHTFASTSIYAAGDAPELGISIPYSCPEGTVLCNGEESPAWYRLSNLFGYTTVEWPGSLKAAPPIPSAAKVTKPTFHNCDCFPGFIRVGRYGAWQKGVLSHQAYHTTLEMLS